MSNVTYPNLCLVGKEESQYLQAVEMIQQDKGPFVLWRPWSWEVWQHGVCIDDARDLPHLEKALAAREWHITEALVTLWERASTLYL